MLTMRFKSFAQLILGSFSFVSGYASLVTDQCYKDEGMTKTLSWILENGIFYILCADTLCLFFLACFLEPALICRVSSRVGEIPGLAVRLRLCL